MLAETRTPSDFGDLLGFVVTSAARDRVTGQMEVAAQHLNGAGIVHGGALMSFADELGARGALANLAPGSSTTTIESKTNFFRGCGLGLVRGESVPLHLGRSTMVWQTTLTGEAGKSIAMITQTQMVLQGAASAREVEKAPPAGTETRPATAEERRAAILWAGSKVMGARGFANATMKEIASVAGMHVPTMYQYVRSKDELLFQICAERFQALIVDVDAAIAGKSGAGEKLEAAILALVRHSEEYRLAMRLIARETAVLEPQVRDRVHAEWYNFLRRFSTIIEDGVKSGEFDPIEPNVAAHLIESVCEAWAIRRFVLRRHGLPNVEAAMLQLVMSGIRRKEAA